MPNFVFYGECKQATSKKIQLKILLQEGVPTFYKVSGLK